MTAPEPPTAEDARTALAVCPFSALLGTRLASFGPDGATLELDVRDELRQQHGFVHGGVVSYLVDNAMAFAAGAVLGTDLVTGGFTIDYVRPAIGARLQARATPVQAGTNTAVLQCEVHTVDGTGSASLCAIGQGRVTRRSRRR